MTRTDPAGQDDVPERFQIDFTGQTLLGLYRIERRLADGGMGSVYLAEDTNLGRRVVVKVPHARFLGEPGFRARFRREIEELVRLEHPHVVRILARGEQDGIPFFVLQYLGGGSLEDRLAKGPQPLDVARGWLDTIAETLDFVHARGIVHRDVKPANILFDEDGHVFLSDFGVVKALGGKEDRADLTAAGTGIGSPLYMAPEQGVGKNVSAASDQYALASTLYEAVSGEPPFGRGSIYEIIVRKGREEAAPLRQLMPSLPEPSDAAVARALALDPLQRFPTCGAFADAYGRGLTPVDAPTPTRSHRPILVVFALLAALVVAGIYTRGFGLWATAAPATPVAVAPPLPARPMKEPLLLLRLLDPGTEPRTLLRWTFTPGGNEARSTRLSYSQSMRANDEPPMVMAGVSEHDYEVRVMDVGAAGRAQLEWIFHPVRPLLEGGATPESVAMERKAAEALGTLSGTSLMSPTGMTLEAALKTDKKINDQATQEVLMVEQTMREAAVRLPDDPLGVGARWEITRIKEILGINYQEIGTYEVLALDGPSLRLRFEFKTEAPDQPLVVPGMGAEEKMRVSKFTTEVKGEALIDLRRVVPVENAAAGKVVYVAEVSGPEVGKMTFEKTFEARTTTP